MTEVIGSAGKTEYLALAKSVKGAAAADLISRALDHAGLYTFGELLEMPNISSLAGTQYDTTLNLLKLFAYGDYQEYKGVAAQLPQLTPAQLMKIRHLSIVSLAAKKKVIPYDILTSYLEINNVRELEDLIIEAIYQKIILGKLDQKTRALEVEFAIGRDIRPGQIDEMILVLQNWCQNSEKLLKAIDDKLTTAAKAVQQNRKEKEEFDAESEALKVKVMKSPEFAMDYRKGDFHSAEYSEEDSRRGKGSRQKFFKHGSSGSRHPTAG